MSFQSAFLANCDRPLYKADGDQRPLGKALPKVVYGVLAALCKVLFRYEVKGRETIQRLADEGKGAVIVANHSSYVEVVLAYISAMPATWVRFIGKQELFEKLNYFPGWFFSAIGAFPVARDSADLSVVKRAVRDVRNGEMVLIYPEGTRRGRGNVQLKIHSGASLIARMAKTPLVPSACRNADKVKRKGERLRFPKLTYVYGEPVYLSDFDFLPKKDRLDACSWFVMRECYALLYNISPEEVDMPALFPDDRDFTAELTGFVPESRKSLPGEDK